MRNSGNRLIARFLATSLLGALWLTPLPSGAAEQTQAALNATSDEELQLFWDEKELYVQTATRAEKPIVQVAENMTVITAREIEAMNAHSINEVLSRIPGVFAEFGNNDFSATAQLHIQGSESRHVTVLLDGMRINFLSGGNAETSFIPLRIVERIEIIRGAASSAWGSALGGVINIITRPTGARPLPSGMLAGSYGEGDSREFGGEVAGKNGPLGYYLYAGEMASDGLRNKRDYRRDSAFIKLLLTPTRDLDITLSGGFSEPESNGGALPAFYVRSTSQLRSRFLNASFEYRATPELTVRGGGHAYETAFDQAGWYLSTYTPSPGQLRVRNIWDELTYGGNLRATWTSGVHTLTVGGEASRGTLDQTIIAGPRLQSAGYPASVTIGSSVDKWALFANDTLEFGSLAVTPGVRLDHDSLSGYFFSPSLGLTWELGERTVARASVARGFTSPPLSSLAGGGPYTASNRQLKEEYGWSYQIGLESGLADLVNLKGTLFRHETGNAMVQVPATATSLSTYTNQGDVTRQGYELELESVPFYNLSLKAGHAYAHIKGESVQQGLAGRSYDNYSWLIGVKYDDRRSFNALLSGRYVWWDYVGTPKPRYDTFIWDLTATRKFRFNAATTLDAFLTIHNLFSGAHYSSGSYPNPRRWVEGGLRFFF